MEKENNGVPPEKEEVKPPEADTPPEGGGEDDGAGEGKPPEEKKEEVPKDIRNLRRKAETAEKFLKEQGYEIDPATQTVRKIEQPPTDTTTPDDTDIDSVIERKLQERDSESQKQRAEAVIASELERLSGGDEKLKDTIKNKFDSFKGDRPLTEQEARDMVYDAAVVVGASRGKKVSSFMSAGAGGAGGGRPATTPDERSARINEKMDWLRNTAGYRFQNKDQNDLMNKLRR